MPTAEGLGFWQGLADNKKPIPAVVPQHCQVQGLVAHPTNKDTTVCPDTNTRNDTTFAPKLLLLTTAKIMSNPSLKLGAKNLL